MTPRPPEFRINPRHAVVSAALCWLGFAIVAWAVHTGHAQTLDDTGLLFWRNDTLAPKGSTALLEAVRDVTALGGVVLRNLFAIGAVVALVFMARRREAALFALTIVSGWLVNSAIKALVARPRPQIVPHLTEAGGNSFPSGHSFNSAVVYIAMALAFAALSPRASVRHTLIGVAALLTLVIAWSRVWLGVHWPSDVTAGWLGGAGWALLASALLHRPAQVTASAIETLTEPDSPAG
ncbi:phosphatase PAP2 family protein [Novosphingobium sp. Leaf2]|uniref:phosphatase PAP2 family protein n=1 Tax=Novosphingobium sp. Leaf2 TaxID=1735670 RepID=UPI0006FAF794|nr:phosphatase PAP2 family protein [Novosphingobium sp. Leaf2]KQM18842.1 PA-phosphatase [Novosphingobium sp. Leaf2]